MSNLTRYNSLTFPNFSHFFRFFEFIFLLGAERVDDDVCLLIVCLFMHFTQVLRFLLAGLLSEEILIVQFVGCD